MAPQGVVQHQSIWNGQNHGDNEKLCRCQGLDAGKGRWAEHRGLFRQGNCSLKLFRCAFLTLHGFKSHRMFPTRGTLNRNYEFLSITMHPYYFVNYNKYVIARLYHEQGVHCGQEKDTRGDCISRSISHKSGVPLKTTHFSSKNLLCGDLFEQMALIAQSGSLCLVLQTLANGTFTVRSGLLAFHQV